MLIILRTMVLLSWNTAFYRKWLWLFLCQSVVSIFLWWNWLLLFLTRLQECVLIRKMSVSQNYRSTGYTFIINHYKGLHSTSKYTSINVSLMQFFPGVWRFLTATLYTYTVHHSFIHSSLFAQKIQCNNKKQRNRAGRITPNQSISHAVFPLSGGFGRLQMVPDGSWRLLVWPENAGNDARIRFWPKIILKDLA